MEAHDFVLYYFFNSTLLAAWLAVSVEPFVLNTTCTHDMRIKNVRMVENVIEMLRRGRDRIVEENLRMKL
jgi:hypothetical protein